MAYNYAMNQGELSQNSSRSIGESPIATVGNETFLNVAAYKFVEFDDLPERRRQLWLLAHQHALRGTILVSPEGINLFLAGSPKSVESFLEILKQEPTLNDLTVKRSWTDFQPFRRLLVKIKKEIIAFGIDSIKPAHRTSPKLAPETLKQWLDAGKPITLLDTRNDYEVGLGTFRGAIDFGIRHFREFPTAVDSLSEDDKSKPLVMFCTGGIRCEKAGPFMEQRGFREVYQLDGGILNYFERCGNAHYEGDCFVFDHRVAVKPDLQPSGAKLCFACQSVLTADDLASENYVPEVSCPHCYTSPDQQRQRLVNYHQRRIDDMAANLPGCQAYENRQPMFVAMRYAGWNLIDWLVDSYRGRSKEEWLECVRRGAVLTGSHYLSASTRVDETQTIHEGQVYVLVQPDYVEPRVNGAIQIIYEDPWLVVVDKPAPLPVHASGQFFRNTLEYFLTQVYRPEKIFLAHRLDASTTGLLVVTRRHAVAGKLQQQFADGQVTKVYLARVEGHPAEDVFSSQVPISRDKAMAGSRKLADDGLPSATNFRVLERSADGTSLIEVTPLTGRTHQIRLHLAGLGFPIVGDSLYGASRESLPLHLHAWKLSFSHPVEHRQVQVATGLPSWAGSLAAFETIRPE